MVGKIVSVQSCPPSRSLLILFFLAVESFRRVVAISFSVLNLNHISYPARFARWQIERQRVCLDPFTKTALVVCLSACHNLGNLLAGSGCLPCFDLAPRHVSDLRPGPVNAFHLTRHGADGIMSLARRNLAGDSQIHSLPPLMPIR